MIIFCVFLCLPHWVFFYTYFECCVTMPYFYAREKVPMWVKICLKSLNVYMLASSVIAPVLTFWAGNAANVYFFTLVQEPGFNATTADYTPGIKDSNMEFFWLNYTLAIQFFNGLILFVSIIQIRFIIKKHGYNKMVDQVSFVIHGALFVTYIAAVSLMVVWNHSGHGGLANLTEKGFSNFGIAYQNWMRSYYQCLLLFSWANCCVQGFTIYIFFNLTKITTERKIDNPSLISVESVKRISQLDTDAHH